MNRFRTLLSGAALCAATATSIWAQVPVVQPSQLNLQPIRPAEVPIVSPATGLQRALTLPAIPVVSPNKPAEIPVVLPSAVDAKTNAKPLLPAISRPGAATSMKAQQSLQSAVDQVPIVRRPLPAVLENPINGEASESAAVLGGQLKTEHPDISLPTGVPIVHARAGVAAASNLLQAGANEAETKIQSPVAPQEMPAIVQGPTAVAGRSELTTPPGSTASPPVTLPPIVVAGMATADKSARVITVPPIVNSIPVVKSPDAGSPAGESPSPASTAAKPAEQEITQVPIQRPEIALPPIRPGEEFPRTPEVPQTNLPGESLKQLSRNLSVGEPSTSRVPPTNQGTRYDFEQVPVGSGWTGTQPSPTRPASAIVQPAVPGVGKSLVEFGTTERGSASNQDVMPAEIPVQNYSGQGSLDHYGHAHEIQDSNLIGENYLHQGVAGECGNCGGAGCSHCGLGAWNGLGNREFLNVGGGCDNGCFGLMPCAQNYFIGDVLYWTRNGGDVVGTNFGGVYDYDWNFGTMVTMGTRVDPLYGHELTYFGLFELDAGNTVVSPAGAIDARFNPTGGLGYGQTYAFFDGEEVTQTAASRLHSFQVNRVRLGWDVVQSHLGLRYIWFEDEYDMTTRNIFGESGRLSLQAANHLIGPEVGVKLFYDVGRRISFSSHWKLGGYLNAYRSETYLENDGVPRVNNSDSGTGFSASFDLGANAHIHLTQRMRLRGGYGILWLWDVASVSGNFPYTLTPSSGTSTNDSESAIFHGANLGFEYYW